jgi:hypothetical protein
MLYAVIVLGIPIISWCGEIVRPIPDYCTPLGLEDGNEPEYLISRPGGWKRARIPDL